MPKLLPLLLCLLCCLSASGKCARSIRVDLGGTDSPVIRSEISTYLEKLFTNPVDLTGKGQTFDIIIGTPASSEHVRAAVKAGKITLPDGPNRDQGYTVKTIGGTIYIASSTREGVLYGLYTFLEAYGAYFQITGERLPAKAAFTAKQIDIKASPAFKYRGLLPWDNFSCGMSGYDLADYEELIDRAARMKLNMLQFHFYPGMAFFTEEWDGKPVSPSCIGMPVDVFNTKGSVGESVFGDTRLFGPRPYIENIGNPRAQAVAVQAVMRKVIDYAHARGMKTCVGFELMHPVGGDGTYTDKPDGGMNYLDPVNPKNADLSVQRFRTLTKTYPNSDYYWMWQSEARGVFGRPVGREPGAAEMRAEYTRWAESPDLAGDVDYAYLFREVAKRLTPEERSRLATGGWNIEHLFPRMNPDFPNDLIFASLNAYHQPSAQGRMPNYRVAADGRRAWMIEWWEFDGNQWFPQFRVSWQESMYRQCLEYGVEGVTLLGWKLSAVEHNIRYLADFCWNPKLTAAEFHRAYVTRLYGEPAKPLAEVYDAYDKGDPFTPAATPADDRVMLLGAGWMPLPVPSMPGRPEGLDDQGWRNTVQASARIIDDQTKLLAMDERSIAAFQQALPKLDTQGRSWARLMMNRLRFRTLYLKSMMRLNESLIEYDRVGRRDGIEKARVAASEKAKLAADLARQAIKKYAEDIRNRGDQGVIAQLNEQYYQVLRRHARGLGGEKSSYAEIDWTAFRLTPSLKFDFTQASPWPHRDGTVKAEAASVDGRPTLRLEIGGDGTPYNSVFLHAGALDLSKSPYLDFRVRTTSAEPFAIMFQSDGGSDWHCLNLVGVEQLYKYADGLPAGAISDGKWHRITWNLEKLVREEIGPGVTYIRSIILGSWENPSKPIVLEFRDFAFGKRNMLD